LLGKELTKPKQVKIRKAIIATIFTRKLSNLDWKRINFIGLIANSQQGCLFPKKRTKAITRALELYKKIKN